MKNSEKRVITNNDDVFAYPEDCLIIIEGRDHIGNRISDYRAVRQTVYDHGGKP